MSSPSTQLVFVRRDYSNGASLTERVTLVALRDGLLGYLNSADTLTLRIAEPDENEHLEATDGG